VSGSGEPRSELVPDRAAIRGWIERVFERGVRRPGYPADVWAEQFCAERFRALGLERVRLEPVTTAGWEPRAASLRARGRGFDEPLPCFPLPHSAPASGLELELSAFDRANASAVAGRASLYDVPLLRLPPTLPVASAPPASVDARIAAELGAGGRVYDPRRTFDGALHVLPFGPEIMRVMEPSIDAGAAAFVGALAGYPGDSFEYYVPYDAVPRPIPGVWIRGSDGARLRALLGRGEVRIELTADAAREPITCHNVVGELAGADEEVVIIGSHHDGPWSSAVEDASGVALVLAQAAYWSRVPRGERPHRLVFLLNAAHMAGGAGCAAFIERHAAELDRVVLELHLEHAAREVVERDGRLVPSGLPEPRWWFTSRVPALERAVSSAIVAERLERSLVLTPDALGPHPTTDGGFFHERGVPLVNLLAAPFYLFDAADRMDRVDEEGLVPLTRAAIRIVAATRGLSAKELRASVCAPA
jgi:hypothetical protein